jgi:RNA polymerase sigma-70 factor (ECF subfamily)
LGETTARVQSALDRFRAGDGQALDDIFARSAQRLEQMARRMLRGSFARVATLEQTADVVQEAVIRLLRALPETPLSSPLEFYRLSARTMRRTLIDFARHHYGPEGSAANRAHVPFAGTSTAPGLDPRADNTHNPESLAAWAEFHERVATLPDVQREVFDLLWYSELSQEDAAQLLAVSVPTVKRRWRDAKLAIIEMLGDNLPGEL